MKSCLYVRTAYLVQHCYVWRPTFLDVDTQSTTSRFPPLTLQCDILWTAGSWKPSRWSALSGMALLSQVSENHSAAEFEKSLMMWVRSCSSVLLRREWTFARWMLGIVVREPCLRNLTSAPAYFPLLHLYACLNSTAVPPTRMSNKMSE